MKKLILFTLFVFITVSLFSQSCLPEGITFTTQEQIDNFQTNHPGCTEIEGDVRVSCWGEVICDITNLNGLSILTSIQGNLEIYHTNSLETLTGLDNLTSVEGNVTIGSYGVDALAGYVTCWGNSSMSALTGLDNLTYIGGNLNIYCNEMLTDFTGLGNLTTIEGDLNIGHAHTTWGIGDVTSAGNEVLTTLSGMKNVSYIGGDLKIEGNIALTKISGLNSAIFIGGDLSIKYNDTLSMCEVQSICEYLIVSNDSIDIHDNAPGCNSQQEVEEACASSINEVGALSALNVSPNPFTTSTTIKYELKQPETVHFSVYNQLGQLVYQYAEEQIQGGQQLEWDASKQQEGLYFYRLEAGDQIATGKLVKTE